MEKIKIKSDAEAHQLLSPAIDMLRDTFGAKAVLTVVQEQGGRVHVGYDGHTGELIPILLSIFENINRVEVFREETTY